MTLGQAGQIYFVPGNKAVKEAGPPPRAPADVGADGAADALRTCVKTYPASGSFAIEIYLPRRAMYVMSGAARTEWKHGIRQQKPGALPPPPAWNRFNMRRALTLRATKAFSDACLQQRLRQATSESEATELQRRIAQQAKFRPSNSDARLDDSDLAELRSRAESMRVRVATMPYLRARFSPSELTFPLPPSAAREAAEVVGASARGGGPENLWPGGGRRLDGGAACGTSGADDTSCARGAEWTVRSGVIYLISDDGSGHTHMDDDVRLGRCSAACGSVDASPRAYADVGAIGGAAASALTPGGAGSHRVDGSTGARDGTGEHGRVRCGAHRIRAASLSCHRRHGSYGRDRHLLLSARQSAQPGAAARPHGPAVAAAACGSGERGADARRV